MEGLPKSRSGSGTNLLSGKDGSGREGVLVHVLVWPRLLVLCEIKTAQLPDKKKSSSSSSLASSGSAAAAAAAAKAAPPQRTYKVVRVQCVR